MSNCHYHNNMKKGFSFLLAAILLGSCEVSVAAASPTAINADVAAADSTDGVAYRDKHVRFTVITDGFLRMEYAPKGRFVDDKSLLMVNRKYPKCDFAVSDDGKTVTVSTSKMKVQYRKNSGRFTPDNLSITSRGNIKPFEWHPGMEQKENLMGTTRTLDQWDGSDIMLKGDDGKRHPHPRSIDKGLLARDGWTFIDDSRNFLFDNDPDWEWVKKRKLDKGAQDWYFLAYGNDYKTALKDFTTAAGKIALPPRYAFGYWWSRWWAYSEHEFKQLIGDFADYQIPLEVLVIDMDWHYSDPAHGGWTGWTWNEWLFPDHTKFLNYLRDKNLKVTLNLHPASGVKKFEAAYPAIALENGIDPATEKTVPWVSSDKRFITSVFKHILKPMNDNGVTFWWLDWQQEPFDSKIDSLSNTWWLNYTFFTKMAKDSDVRPLLYHRWGGLGNHRYQIGFSGDNYATWKSLDFLPYFTSTASNVCYGFWSHDLGGHYMAQGDTCTNPELYTRSMQFGTYAPIMRTHSNKNARLMKEPWNFDRNTLNNIRSAIQNRYRLVPYIYTMARKAHDTSISICRPMYYNYPDEEKAYTIKNQYMFGDNMIVRPVTAPGVDGYAEVEVWLPKGQWYEQASGTMLEGGKTYSRKFAINEVPVYIAAGAIVPLHTEKEKNLRRNDAPITFVVYPGGNDEFTLYEDFGDDQKYDTEFATTHLTSEQNGNKLTFCIAPRQGEYREMPASRQYTLRTPSKARPVSVKVDGMECDYHYDVTDLAVVVPLPVKNCDTQRIVEIEYPADGATIADGVIGQMKRYVETFGGLKNKYARLRVDEPMGRMATIYEALEYAPEQNTQLLNDFRNRYSRMDEIVKAQDMSDKARIWFLKGLDMNSDCIKAEAKEQNKEQSNSLPPSQN